MGALFVSAVQANGVALLDETDGNAAKDLVTGAANGTKVYAVNAYNNGSAAIDVFIAIKTGVSTINLGKVSVDAAASKNLLDPTIVPALMEDGSVLLGPASILQVHTAVLPSAGENVQVVAQAADY